MTYETFCTVSNTLVTTFVQRELKKRQFASETTNLSQRQVI